MASRIDNLAEWLSGGRLEGSSLASATTTITGTAVSSSDNGLVTVVISDDTTQGDESAGVEVKIPTTTNVKPGDEVIITNVGTDTIKSPTVTGVVGRGDEIVKDIGKAADAAASAETASTEAQEAATAVSQHFFADDGGIHVATADGDANTGHNLLANAEGILMRDGTVLRTAQTASGFAVYDGDGNDPENIVALFAKDGATIGRSSTSGAIYSNVTDGGFALRHGDSGNILFYAGSVNGFPGAGITDTNDGKPMLSLGNDGIHGEEATPFGANSVSIGPTATATGTNAFAQGDLVIASGDYSHAEGSHTEAGAFSHVEGSYAIAGNCSHAEGANTVANIYSHAEGQQTSASNFSHAEGSNTSATGYYSHAGGNQSSADGYCSFAHGYGVKAETNYFSALGQYNEGDGLNIFEIGNGSNVNGVVTRKNAFAVRGNGGAVVSGKLETSGIASNGNADITGTLVASGKVSANGGIATSDISAGGNITGQTINSQSTIGANGNITSGGDVKGSTVSSDGTITAKGAISGTTLAATGGGITARGEISTTTKVSANNQVTANSVNLAPTVLYQNGGGTTGNVTLNQNAYNFEFIEIFFMDNDGIYDSVKFRAPSVSGVTVTVNCCTVTNFAAGCSAKTKTFNVKNNTMTIKTNSSGQKWAGQFFYQGSAAGASNNNDSFIKVVEVLGY